MKATVLKQDNKLANKKPTKLCIVMQCFAFERSKNLILHCPVQGKRRTDLEIEYSRVLFSPGCIATSKLPGK